MGDAAIEIVQASEDVFKGDIVFGRDLLVGHPPSQRADYNGDGYTGSTYHGLTMNDGRIHHYPIHSKTSHLLAFGRPA
jgi:hypothetical protein